MALEHPPSPKATGSGSSWGWAGEVAVTCVPPSALALPPAPSLSRPCRTDWFGEAVGQGAGTGLRGQGSPSPPAPLCLHKPPQTSPNRTWWLEHPGKGHSPTPRHPHPAQPLVISLVSPTGEMVLECQPRFWCLPKLPVPARGGTGTSCPAHPMMSPPRASDLKVRSRLP